MIPDFEIYGNLPPGIYWANWEEVAQRYGSTPVRTLLLAGLRDALLALQRGGCNTVYLNGSFVTANDSPGDFDACWEIDGVSLELLDPVFLDFSNGQAAQKEKFGGELFPVIPPRVGELSILEFFQYDRHMRRPKGIIAINLGTFE